MYIDVLVETNIKKDLTFVYKVKEELIDKIEVGKRVLVPFSNKEVQGFILGINSNSKFDYDIKEIINVIDDKVVLSDELINLGKYISEKYLCSLISSYQTMLPKALKAKVSNRTNKKYNIYVKLVKDIDTNNNSMLEIINILKEKKQVLKRDIKNKYSLKKLIDLNIVSEYKEEEYRKIESLELEHKNVILNDEQNEAIKKIVSNLNKEKIVLIHGVTGSGKTEVYIESIKEVIKKSKTAIVLVPEISLTPQTIARFKNVFGDLIAVLHSGLSDGERYDEYRKIVNNEVKIVIGARSAIFAPLKDIGMIIIDEEHVSTYKQENNPRYNAIEIAIERSKYHKCPVILGSATPSIESYARAIKGYYDLITLPTRVNNQEMPKTVIIDMKEENKKGNILFSDILIDNIKSTLLKKEKIMLLLNKRGYANYISCGNCGYTHKCPNCDITLTYHKTSQMMRCHYCGYANNKITKCPDCNSENIKIFGSGTEKVEEKLNELFPNVRICRMDLDTTTNKGSHQKIIKDFNNEKYDILVGTQMISKGLDFPNVTLVGVINADSSLNIPNFRSSEQTFQLITQIIGRSGRSSKKGLAIIQTFNPNHYSILYASKHDYKSFYNEEITIRKKLNYPPYCFLVLIKIVSKDFELLSKESNKISDYLKSNLSDKTIVLGPSISNILRVNNYYNFQCIIKYKKDDKLYEVLNSLDSIYQNNKSIKLEFDFNPIKL
ncbi:MAG TPA: primosomal protein N' [Bacilli bacterium]|nr:primosomal protein N' [Bacilli bacterium]